MSWISATLHTPTKDDMVFISSHSINWSRWRPRNDNRSWFFAGKMKRWDTKKVSLASQQYPLVFHWNTECNALFHDPCQVTALRRQVRPVSGKVSRKVSLPEPLQDPSHRATPARMHTYGVSSSNGARCGIWVCECVLRLLSHSLVLKIPTEPSLVPQEFPSADGKCLPQQDSQGQVAVAGETCQWHHHAEDDHLEHGVRYEQTAEGNASCQKIKDGCAEIKKDDCVFLSLHTWKITFSCEKFLVYFVHTLSMAVNIVSFIR